MARKAPPDPERVIQGMTEFNVDELAGYHRNPRRGDVDAIARSLEINGQYRPIVVNIGTHTGRPLEVLAGNHTLAGARQLGWPTIQATTVDVDDLAAARIVAADNRTADLGGYDDTILAELLAQIAESPIGLAGTGYDPDQLAEMLLDEPADSGAIEPYAERFEVVVECPSEERQQVLFDQLSAEGWTCRLLSL